MRGQALSVVATECSVPAQTAAEPPSDFFCVKLVWIDSASSRTVDQRPTVAGRGVVGDCRGCSGTSLIIVGFSILDGVSVVGCLRMSRLFGRGST